MQKAALAVGVAAAALLAVLAVFRAEALFRGYFVAALFWLGITLGCLVLLMIYHLTGGGWGLCSRRVLEAATRTLPLLLVLFLPLLLGVHVLYRWTDPEVVAGDAIVQSKTWYLNLTGPTQVAQPYASLLGFYARTVYYFLIWLVLAFWLNRWSRRQDVTGDPRLARRMTTLSGPGLVLYGLTITFASTDWIMSLQPHWYSTIFPMIIAAGEILSGVAFAIVVLAMLGERPPLVHRLVPRYRIDLGNILLTFVLFWTYVAFSQYLLIWSGNLPKEIEWYVPRTQGGWQYLAALLLAVQFFVPFWLLLFRNVKRDRRSLAVVAVLVLLMRLIDVFWHVVPAFGPADLASHGLDALAALVATIALGGLWIALFLWQLGRLPLVALHEMPVAEVPVHGRTEPA